MPKKKKQNLLQNKLEKLFDKVIIRTLYVSYVMYVKYESLSFDEYLEKYNSYIKDYDVNQIEEQIAILRKKENVNND